MLRKLSCPKDRIKITAEVKQRFFNQILTFEASRTISTRSDDFATAITWKHPRHVSKKTIHYFNADKRNQHIQKQLSISSIYLPTAPLAFRGSFNDTRKIEKLDFGIIVMNNSRNASKCCELIWCSFRMCPSQHR